MFEIDGKVFRNLEEQVQKNKEDIANHYAIDRVLANFGIKIVGQVATESELPDATTYTGQYGDAYAVGATEPYSFWIFTRPDINAGHPTNYWLDVGGLAIVGPQGPQGPQGLQGIQGPVGPQGPQGDVGGFINIRGILDSIDQLPTPTSLNNLTVAYLVGTNKDLYIQVGETSEVATWNNVGPFNAATLVMVQGVAQNVWDADTKVDKTTISNMVYCTGTGGVPDNLKLTAQTTGNTIMYRDNSGRSKVQQPTTNYEIANKLYVDNKAATKYDKINKVTIEERADSEQTTIISNGRVRSYSAPSAVDSYWSGVEPTGLTIHYVKSPEQTEDPGAIYHWHLQYPEESEYQGDKDILNTPPSESGELGLAVYKHDIKLYTNYQEKIDQPHALYITLYNKRGETSQNLTTLFNEIATNFPKIGFIQQNPTTAIWPVTIIKENNSIRYIAYSYESDLDGYITLEDIDPNYEENIELL